MKEKESKNSFLQKIPSGIEFIYVGDPMCTWCWGIAEEFSLFRKKFKDKVKFSLVLGGIRAGEYAVSLDLLKESLKPNWIKVAEVSGQEFNLDFFDRENFLYDSEPSCRAVVTFSTIMPDKVFEYKESLEKYFYTKNSDLKDDSLLAQCAAEFGIDTNKFLSLFHSEAMKDKTIWHFDLSDTLDVRGLPTILIKSGNQEPIFFGKGFMTVDEMEALFMNHLKGIYPEDNSTPSNLSCDLSNPTC